LEKIQQVKKVKKERSRWFVLLTGCIVNFCISGPSTFSLFVKPIMDLTDWPMASVALSFTLFSMMLSVPGIIVGTFSHRVPPWSIIYFGSILFSVGWILSGFARSVTMLQLCFGLISGIGSGAMYNFTITNALKWFPDRRGFAAGLLLGCSAVGPVFCAPVASVIIRNMGVFSTFKILGTFFAILLLSTSWLIRVPPADYRPPNWTPSPVAAAALNARNYTWKEMLRTSSFYLLFLIFVLACTSSMIMLNLGAVIGQERAGMSMSMATLSVTLLALFNFTGRFLFGALSDKIGRYRTLLIALCFNFVAMLSLSVITTELPFLAMMCLVGACGGALLVMFPPIVSERFGLKHSGLNYSIMFIAYSTAALVAPLLASYYRNQGNYTPVFIWAAGMTVVAAILLFIVMKQNKSEKEKTS
jgi:Arabinose efflux permease